MAAAGAYKLIVGVDFGTTYTGVSFVLSTRAPKDVYVIRSWSGASRPSDNAWKTPSRIAYAEENPNHDKDQIGFDVTPGMTSYSWFKLLLDRAAERRFDDPDLRDIEGPGMLRLPRNKTAQQVCADFLRGIYQKTFEELNTRMLASVVNAMPIDFSFTVPAIWSDKAKADTIASARAAGFGSRPGDTITLITEPEAAAISVMKYLADDGNDQLQKGDSILIVDCGGGTIDLTGYDIERVVPELEFSELLVGEGGKCGSTHIDRRFHQWMSDTFGAAFDSVPFPKKGPGSKFMREFESIKVNFGSETVDQTYEIPLLLRGVQSCPNYDMEETMVKFSKRDLQEFFEPVVQNVIGLIEQQVAQANIEKGKSINKIILVGGFGDSRYLLDAVREWGRLNGNFEIICPVYPQAAIVIGASIRGLGGPGSQPRSRKCRRHYGFQLDLPYDEINDDKRHMYHNEYDRKRYTRGTMVWKIPMGCEIDENTLIKQHIKKPWFKGESLQFTLGLYSSSLDPPPKREEHPRVHKVGTIKVDLTDKDLKRFKRKWKVTQDRWVWQLEYEIQILFGQREGTLCFRAKCGDNFIGSTQIEYARE
ncbi:actin-like ATPase domain-containing protein [Rhizodiscina lignyota]|uniref:Actin-like ATPase domain-containing protein n=1 Tax=Rhizodiscina lignyota TaxID=1504668 RepID=A0A9P4M9I2_9PEZI|nr:actin-like ATPase domain-containing protein [Rhizodiscina lignyota]